MNKLEEYILRYQALHDGSDPFIAGSEKKFNNKTPGAGKVIFDGSQLGKKLPPFIQKYINKKQKAITLLDYGCGKAIHNYVPLREHGKPGQEKRTLIERFEGMIQCYYCFDPAVEIYNEKPPQGMVFDVVCCADVMEHIPEDFVEHVLLEIFSYTKDSGVAMFTISGNPAVKTFKDGENLHATVRSIDWWLNIIQKTSAGKSFLMFHNDETKPNEPVQLRYHNSANLNVWDLEGRGQLMVGGNPCVAKEI